MANLLGADISGGKNSGDGGTAVLPCHNIAAGVRFHQISIEGGIRRQTDGNEYPGQRNGLHRTILDDGDAVDLTVSQNFRDLGLEAHFNVFLFHDPLHQRCLTAEFVLPHQQMDGAANAGKIQRILQRRIAAAYYGNLLSAEKRAVTDCTPANAVTCQPILTGYIQMSAANSHGKNHPAGFIADVAVGADPQMIALRLQTGGLFKGSGYPQLLHLLSEPHGKLPALGIGRTRHIFNDAGFRHLTAEGLFLHQKGASSCPETVEGGSQTCGTAADDADIIHNHTSLLWILLCRQYTTKSPEEKQKVPAAKFAAGTKRYV